LTFLFRKNVLATSLAVRYFIPRFAWLIFTLASGVTFFVSPAVALDLKNAAIFVPAGAGELQRKVGGVLSEEIAKRTQISLPLQATWPTDGRATIAIFVGTALEGLPASLAQRLPAAPDGDEGFRAHVVGSVLVIVGNSEPAALFGAGYTLRQMRLERGVVQAPDTLSIATSPHHALRGHQVGYRPKVNSYDGWTPAIFDQYVRDLAMFGTNAIELIPPRSDDDDDSPHFTRSKIDMMVEWSRIIASYGLQVWVWYPAMDKDYSDSKDVDFALKEWAEVFKRLPRIDAVLVPGGDPGHTQPKYLMALLEKQTKSLRSYHPKATMWVSPQGFTAEWMDEFLGLVNKEPEWLAGLAFGPQVRVPLPELRKKIPARFAIRLYPDITHSLHAEYAVPDWDLAYAVTMGREVYNPRPDDEAKIFHFAAPYTIGTISYSEGVNDDVNKVVWSALGWDPQADLKGILREYARYLISYRLGENVAEGLLSLERNWRGSLLSNSQVDATFAQFQSMERNATPQELLNWRFQQMLYRAYFDYYVRTRLIYETSLQRQAVEKLRARERMGSMLAMDEAEKILDQAVTRPMAGDIRARMGELAEAQYQSIRAQLTVDRYRASAVSRGASLDTADYPLNDRWWLKGRFAEIRKMPDELERLAALDALANRTNPGPGGFYDDLGNVAAQPRLQPGIPFDQDPGSFHSPRVSHLAFGGGLTGRRSFDAARPDVPGSPLLYPMAWWSYVEGKYDAVIVMSYTHLDPNADYKVRVVYLSRGSREARVRLMANDTIEVHPYLKKTSPFETREFDVPHAATAGGMLRLSWNGEPGVGGSGSGPMIAEVMLIRK
jgi:hypothetical protein